MPNRKPNPTDTSDEEWAFVAPYLALLREDAPQRVHDLREVFDALRWIVRAGASWRMLPHDFPRGRWSTSRHEGGSLPASSSRWSTTSGSFCAWPPAALQSQQRRSSTAARCAPLPKAAIEPATTGPSARRARRYMRPWTPWVTCWR